MNAPSTASLSSHVTAACAAWPTLAIDADAYRTWLAAQGDAVERLASLEPRDVVLAWAAGSGDAEALRLLEQHYFVDIRHALRRFDADAALVEEITQRLRIKLLVADEPGGLAPIASYALGGRLGGLIRVAAIREALNQRRDAKPAAPVEALDQLADRQDPALAALKRTYAAEFERAFTAAVAELAGKERHLLRLSLSVHASIDDIARIYKTHRATAARWLNAARDQLAANTRAHLQRNLGLPDDELTSLLRLIRTEATRLLDSIAPGPDE